MKFSQKNATRMLQERVFYRSRTKVMPTDSHEKRILIASCSLVLVCGIWLFTIQPLAAIPILFILDDIIERG